MKKTKIINFYLLALAFVTAASVVLRTVALLTSFNSVTMYFDNRLAINAASIIVVLSILGFASYMFVAKRGEDLIAKSDNAASYIPSGIVSVALLFMGVEMISGITMMPVGVLRTLSVLSAALAFLSVGSFFLTVFIEKRHDIYKASFSLCIVVFLAVYSCFLFFNKQVHPTNSPNKLVDQMAYLFAAVFFLYETRIPLGRAKWRGYVAFGLMATLLTAYSAIPSLIVYAINGYNVSNSLIESVLSLTLAILIGSKVFQTKYLTKNVKCEAATNIEALAQMRENEIEEQRKALRAREYNNEENDDAEDAANYTMDIPYIETFTDFGNDDSENGGTQYSD